MKTIQFVTRSHAGPNLMLFPVKPFLSQKFTISTATKGTPAQLIIVCLRLQQISSTDGCQGIVQRLLLYVQTCILTSFTHLRIILRMSNLAWVPSLPYQCSIVWQQQVGHREKPALDAEKSCECPATISTLHHSVFSSLNG